MVSSFKLLNSPKLRFPNLGNGMSKLANPYFQIKL